MNKATLLVLCMLCAALAHKDKPQTVAPEHKSKPEFIPEPIYKPFTDVPTPQNGDTVDVKVKVKEDSETKHDHQNLSPQKQQEYEQFNQMLGYGLVIGTFVLAILLTKTCTIKGKRPAVRMVPATQRYTYNPQPQRANSIQIRNRIQMHKLEIAKLEQLAKQVQRQEVEQRKKQMKREQQVIKAYYNQYEMQQRIQPRVQYNVYSTHPYYQYHDNIPIGRPLSKDNDSSFASEYPTL